MIGHITKRHLELLPKVMLNYITFLPRIYYVALTNTIDN